VADYITFARIQAVRSGTSSYEMLIGPPSSLETFPDLASFGLSLLLKESFARIDKYLSGKEQWRRWLLFSKPQKPDGTPVYGTPIDGPSTDGPSIDVKLILAPVTVSMDEKHLRTVTSAFEKQRTVILKVNQDLTLTDIELVQER
jgi:hypothetical protein